MPPPFYANGDFIPNNPQFSVFVEPVISKAEKNKIFLKKLRFKLIPIIDLYEIKMDSQCDNDPSVILSLGSDVMLKILLPEEEGKFCTLVKMYNKTDLRKDNIDSYKELLEEIKEWSNVAEDMYKDKKIA